MNLVLIGIMGSGKTVVGKMLSNRLKMSFVDVDRYIEEHYGSIPFLFEKGEAHFREIESEVIKTLSMLQNTVISTGGGVIKNTENITCLKQNGIIFFLDRPIRHIVRDIDTSHRPLLKDGPEKLIALHQERYALYMNACNHRIDASKGFKYTLSQIISLWNEHSSSISNE